MYIYKSVQDLGIYMSVVIWAPFKLWIKFIHVDRWEEFPTVMEWRIDLSYFLLREGLKKSPHLLYFLVKESIYALLYHLFTILCWCIFSTLLVYPMFVSHAKVCINMT